VAPFPFIFRRREPTPENPSAAEETMPAHAESSMPAPRNAPALDGILSHLLGRLEGYLPPPSPDLPANRVTAVAITRRTVGIGNWRGTEKRAGFAEIALKGGRLEVVFRFQLWGDSPEAVEDSLVQLQQGLLADGQTLRQEGFLIIEGKETSLAEYVEPPSGWRKTADYRMLYEYHYQEMDGAESLIARIPIHTDLERVDSDQRETGRVTDELVRWDDLAATPLNISPVGRPVTSFGLASLAFLPAGWEGAPVSLARLRRDAGEAPTEYPDLEAFLAAVTRDTDPDRHARVLFPSIDAFLANFEPLGDPVMLGDWDEDGMPDPHRAARLTFESPIVLPSHDDLLQLSYSEPQLDGKAVLYLRAALSP